MPLIFTITIMLVSFIATKKIVQSQVLEPFQEGASDNSEDEELQRTKEHYEKYADDYMFIAKTFIAMILSVAATIGIIVLL